jgi:hypothetical protein
MRAEIKTGELLKEMAERKERRDGTAIKRKPAKKRGRKLTRSNSGQDH